MISITGLEHLKEKREKVETLKEEFRKKQEQFKKQNEEFFEKMREADDELSLITGLVKDEALLEFADTGSKQLTGGLGIRVGISLIYDQKNALDWAKDHKMCLQLDKKGFEKIAKTEDIGFVKKEEKITVTFPKEIVIGEEKNGEKQEKIKGRDKQVNNKKN